VAGIKTISHYRTDVPTYTRTLVKAKWMHTYVLWLMRIFYWMARPVISPSEDYAKALRDELKVPEDKIQILPRGLPLDDFSPKNRGKGIWEKFGCNKSVRFVFIGRISKEKNLPFLNEVWKKFAAKYNDVELLYVGYGWYLEELKKEFENSPEVHFAGEQGGEILAGLYADADFFLFPSTTDTFGNVVVEAMASGTPAVVSNFGGPRSIVKDESNGFILPIDESAWLHTLEECRRLKLEQTEQYEILRKNAYERSRRYTLENSAKAQFAYFKTVLSKN
jgi:glycosyltransferase involved in cell wall biosynthesis